MQILHIGHRFAVKESFISILRVQQRMAYASTTLQDLNLSNATPWLCPGLA